MYIISACLLGCDCKYNGGNNYNEAVVQFTKEHKYIMICPETAGGLLSPRPPAEIQADRSTDSRVTDNRVIDKEGNDVTDAFTRGAEACLKEALNESERNNEPMEGAILKANSPSCGCGHIYDGTFTGTLIKGDGIFAAMLRKKGIALMTEEDFG